MQICFTENIEILNPVSSAVVSCVRETLQRTEEIQLLYWRCRTSSLLPWPTVEMTATFSIIPPALKWADWGCVEMVLWIQSFMLLPCLCRETVAPSGTARPPLAARPFAPSGRRGAASATLASFAIWKSRYDKGYILDSARTCTHRGDTYLSLPYLPVNVIRDIHSGLSYCFHMHIFPKELFILMMTWLIF